MIPRARGCVKPLRGQNCPAKSVDSVVDSDIEALYDPRNEGETRPVEETGLEGGRWRDRFEIEKKCVLRLKTITNIPTDALTAR